MVYKRTPYVRGREERMQSKSCFIYFIILKNWKVTQTMRIRGREQLRRMEARRRSMEEAKQIVAKFKKRLWIGGAIFMTCQIIIDIYTYRLDELFTPKAVVDSLFENKQVQSFFCVDNWVSKLTEVRNCTRSAMRGKKIDKDDDDDDDAADSESGGNGAASGVGNCHSTAKGFNSSKSQVDRGFFVSALPQLLPESDALMRFLFNILYVQGEDVYGGCAVGRVAPVDSVLLKSQDNSMAHSDESTHEWSIVTAYDTKNSRWIYHNGEFLPDFLWILISSRIKARKVGMEHCLSKDGLNEYRDGKTGCNVGNQAYQTWSTAGYLVAKKMMDLLCVTEC